MKLGIGGLTLVLLALGSGAASAQVSGPRGRDSDALQYMQSCSPGPTFRYTNFGVGGCKRLTVSGDHNGVNRIWRFGRQYKVSSIAATDEFRLCLHYTTTTTVASTGVASVGNPSGETQGYCITIPGASSDYIKISANPWVGGVANWKLGTCTNVAGSNNAAVGGPCVTDADCGGTTGACARGTTPQGLYASICATATSHEAEINECIQ